MVSNEISYVSLVKVERELSTDFLYLFMFLYITQDLPIIFLSYDFVYLPSP